MQCFSTFHVHRNCLGNEDWGLRFCISKKFPGNADGAGPQADILNKALKAPQLLLLPETHCLPGMVFVPSTACTNFASTP